MQYRGTSWTICIVKDTINQSCARIIIGSEVSLAAAEVPQLDSFVVWAGHNNAVTELQARHSVCVITQRHKSLTSGQAPYLQHTSQSLLSS